MNTKIEIFQNKIQEMKNKLNIINADIEEIKNDRKAYEENNLLKKHKSNKQFNGHHKRKNYFRNATNRNDINYIHNKNYTDSKNYFTNTNNTDKPIYNFSNTNFNLTNMNIEEIPKTHYIIRNTIYDNKNIENIEIKKEKNIEMNQNDDISLNKANKSSLCSIKANDEKNLFFDYGNNICHRRIKTRDNFYKNNNNSLNNKYYQIKKNIYYNHNNTHNNNVDIFGKKHKNNTHENIKTMNNLLNINDITPISSIKAHKRKKNINEENIDKNSSHIKNKSFNNISNGKHNKKKNIILNGMNPRTLDRFYKYNDNDNEKVTENIPKKIRAKNNNNIQIQQRNNAEDEDISRDFKRSMTIDNSINKNNKTKKYFKLNDVQNRESIQKPISVDYKKIKKKEIINNINELNIENGNNQTEVLKNIIDITNKYNKSIEKVNMDNIIDEYILILSDNKIKNEFAYKIVNLYNKTNNLNLNSNESESLIQAWNWIKENQKKVEYYKIKNEKEYKPYRIICESIMKEYNLKNIKQLKLFIYKLFEKANNNDNFMAGIKKLLLP